MSHFFTIFSILFLVPNVRCTPEISENKVDKLPPIFHIDDYDKCLHEGKEFCKFSLQLSPRDPENPTETWNTIKKTLQSKRHYNHDKLHYALCANDYYPEFSSNGSVEEIVSKIFTHDELKAQIIDFDCRNYANYFKITTLDTLLMTLIIFYLVLVASATIYDARTTKASAKIKFLVIFSIRHNLSRLLTTNQKINCEKLKCIQGFRFYTTLLIIFCHSFGSFIGGYVSNTKYLEDFSENPLRLALRNLFVFLVQTFFLVSAWLLSYHTFQIFQKHKQINVTRFLLLTFINRYLRILPPLLFMVAVGSSAWIYRNFNGPVNDIYAISEYERCQRNWWINLLFVNNHYKQYDMCYFITWYLSADTQLYAMSLLLLVLIWRFRRNFKIIFGCSLLIGILIPTIVSYVYNLDIIYRITPKKAKYNMFLSFEFNAIYSATYCNIATYIIGLIFGYIYFLYEDLPLFTNKIRIFFWWISFLGFPAVTLIISSHTFSGISAALIGALLKPMYGLGIAIGILGMAQQIGGVAKKVFEWKPAVFLGNITYCTYVVQLGIVFYRTAVAKKPLYVSDLILIQSFARDAFYSFVCGFFLHVLVELPALQLQNLLLPRIRSHQS